MTDVALNAWADQFGAELREKCRALLVASSASGLDDLATSVVDFAAEDMYRLAMTEGAFFLTHLPDGATITLDPLKLGV